MNNKLELLKVSKRFGNVQAISDLSFSVPSGQIMSLLGPSGCGKSTVLRLIAGLEDLNNGEIILDGTVCSSPAKKVFVSPEKRDIGLVFQNYALWPHMSVKQNIAYCLHGRELSRDEISTRVEEVLNLVGLSGLEMRYPFQLSGGQQQRVALARSMAYNPKLVLLDEPLSNLDLRIREIVRTELRSLLKEIGITAVFVTHDQEEAFAISDRIILMNHGSIIQDGTPTQLFNEPANEFVAQFIGKANLLPAKVVDHSEAGTSGQVNVPELGTSLYFSHGKEFPTNVTSVVVRYNEIEIFAAEETVERENVVRGQVVSKEYRGFVTEYVVRCGSIKLTVSSNNLDSKREQILPDEYVYLRIPPEAITPIAQA